MKYIVIVGDGMGDYPIESLNGQTPLMAAKTPNLDHIAENGITGSLKTIPDDFSPGSDVAALSILGYAPAEYYTGRSPLEAASMGINLKESDVAYRCNFVTLLASHEGVFMGDYSAGHISSEDGHVLIDYLNENIGTQDIRFYPGVSYRNLMVWKNGPVNVELIPPHDITEKNIKPYMPKGERYSELIKLMNDSQIALKCHPQNKKKRETGVEEANSIWLWGQGHKAELPSFEEKYNIKGGIISAVDLLKGIGVCANLEIIDVPGITGYLDTNYKGKVKYAIDRLSKELDFVLIHVEAPDEAGHTGSIENKIKAIEDFDKYIAGSILENIKEFKETKILLLCDHFTPVSEKTHTKDSVPFVIYSTKDKKADQIKYYNENILKGATLNIEEGHKLMELFIKGVSS